MDLIAGDDVASLTEARHDCCPERWQAFTEFYLAASMNLTHGWLSLIE